MPDKTPTRPARRIAKKVAAPKQAPAADEVRTPVEGDTVTGDGSGEALPPADTDDGATSDPEAAPVEPVVTTQHADNSPDPDAPPTPTVVTTEAVLHDPTLPPEFEMTPGPVVVKVRGLPAAAVNTTQLDPGEVSTGTVDPDAVSTTQLDPPASTSANPGA